MTDAAFDAAQARYDAAEPADDEPTCHICGDTIAEGEERTEAMGVLYHTPLCPDENLYCSLCDAECSGHGRA